MGRMRRKNKTNYKKFFPLYLMALPGIVYLFINNYMPLPGLVLAFKNYNARKGIYGSDWIGLKNFKFLFATNDAFIITRNTLCYNLVFIIVNTAAAIAVAIILSELTHKIKKFYQSVILLPYMLSMVIVSYLVFGFLSMETGFVNHSILEPLGLAPVAWYTEKKYWPFIIIFMSQWKGVGYNTVVYLASICGIDKTYYEAAVLDGATKWQQIKYITLPLLRPVITILLIMSIGGIFKADFGLFYQLPKDSGPLYPVTNVLDTYIFRALKTSGEIGMSSAAALFQSTVGFVLIMIANKIVSKVDSENALF